MKVLGYEEAVNNCDCCGKTDLKGTFAVERDDGEILYYGSVCVTRHTGKSSRQVKEEAKQSVNEKKERAKKEIIAHPVVIAFEEKIKEANACRVPAGQSFFSFIQESAIAADKVKSEIAAKYGFQAYEVIA